MPATPRLNCSFTEPRCACRGLGLLPPPTKPRPAGVWSLLRFAGSGQARSRLGEGWGGGCANEARRYPTQRPPPVYLLGLLPPPHAGEGTAPRSPLRGANHSRGRGACGRNSAQILVVCSPSAGTAP